MQSHLHVAIMKCASQVERTSLGHTSSMLLRDFRTSLELEIAGYQFPDIEAGNDPLDPDSWDSNWLIIKGTVRTDDDTAWSFEHACLTTWEITELAAWFHNVAAGFVSPLRAGARGSEDGSLDESTPETWLTFTEPVLSFAVVVQSGEHVLLRMELSHQLAQPPLHLQRPTSSHITIDTTRQQLLHAAAALQEQLAVFPAR